MEFNVIDIKRVTFFGVTRDLNMKEWEAFKLVCQDFIDSDQDKEPEIGTIIAEPLENNPVEAVLLDDDSEEENPSLEIQSIKEEEKAIIEPSYPLKANKKEEVIEIKYIEPKPKRKPPSINNPEARHPSGVLEKYIPSIQQSLSRTSTVAAAAIRMAAMCKISESTAKAYVYRYCDWKKKLEVIKKLNEKET